MLDMMQAMKDMPKMAEQFNTHMNAFVDEMRKQTALLEEIRDSVKQKDEANFA